MRRSLFDELDAEWQIVAESSAGKRACVKWGVGEPTLGALVDRVQRRGAPAESDAILRNLVARSATDDLACRTVLQCLMPAMRATARSYSSVDHISDVESTVMTETFDRIRNYPLERRPGNVAANITLDVRQVFWRATSQSMEVFPTDPSRLPQRMNDSLAPPEEVVDVLRHGLQGGFVSDEEAAIIFSTRVLDYSLSDISTRVGIKPQSMRRRRQRAEQKLADRSIDLFVG